MVEYEEAVPRTVRQHLTYCIASAAPSSGAISVIANPKEPPNSATSTLLSHSKSSTAASGLRGVSHECHSQSSSGQGISLI